MPSCHRDDVARFLAGLLNMADESVFVDHLETCRNCREWLEEDSGSDAVLAVGSRNVAAF